MSSSATNTERQIAITKGAEDREMVTLPNDVARCAGVGDDDEGWREGCEDCSRRLAESTGDVVAWMLPPEIIAFWCEFRVAPNAE